MARCCGRCIAIARVAVSSTARRFAVAPAFGPRISSPGFRRGFCRVCGSPVVNRPGPAYQPALANPAIASELGVPLGILDDDPGVRPEAHCFVASKAPWFEITDDLPQYPDYPPAG
jgi:hypothetical protein